MTFGRAHADLVDELIAAGKDAVGRGLVLASGGNLSARLPGSDEFMVTTSGAWLDRLTPQDFVMMSVAGEARRGTAPPSVEWKLHQRTYHVRPDVNAVMHLHPQHAVLVDALGHEIRLITQDHLFYLRKVARVACHPAGSQELADLSAVAAKDHDAMVLAFHGSSTLGDTVSMAVRRAMNLEEAAIATYRCLQLGNTDLVYPPELAAGMTSV